MGIEIECVHDARALVGESAVWDGPTQILYWVDIHGGLVHRFDPSTGPAEPIDVGEKVGCLAPREAGGLILGTESGIYTFDLDTREKVQIADPEADRPDNRFNDASTDRQGRWWLGSMPMSKPQGPTGAFYRLDADRTLMRSYENLTITNGLAFSPDGRTMYFADSFGDVRTIWAADYDPDTGTPSNRRVFFDTQNVAGRPDGGTVDADGCYWMAGVGGWQLVRLTPGGEVDTIVDMPVERPSRPMFGGTDLATLYVTTIGEGSEDDPSQPHAGSLFAVTGLPVGGLPVERFAG